MNFESKKKDTFAPAKQLAPLKNKLKVMNMTLHLHIEPYQNQN
tara:strand:+ start:462 stop:590 length:129 start_codon:yes stop_codon:yes gene_type:complete